MRARRAWHIVERFGRFYVEDQFGGFAGWHTTRETAVIQGRKYVAENPGDTFEDDQPGPSWLELDRGTFDVDAPAPTLLDLEPANVPAPDDGCGTGDLLELI